MANDWFRFKQFMIRQDQCAMKVGTDGVILGAWTYAGGDSGSPGGGGSSPECRLLFSGKAALSGEQPFTADGETASRPENTEKQHGLTGGHAGETLLALDIGTGTGLLALMLAQRSAQLEIDAIELDPAAAEQAAANVAASDFADRIRVQQADFRVFKPVPGRLYDLVVCNPPYFRRSRKASGASRSLARHSDTLELEALFSGTVKILSERGILSIIVPSDLFTAAKELAGLQGLFPARILEVHPVPGAGPRRHCLQFSRAQVTPVSQSLIIEEHGRHGYSDDYRKLTKAFYLDL